MLSNCLLNIYDYICTFVILSGLIRETLLHCIAVLIGSQVNKTALWCPMVVATSKGAQREPQHSSLWTATQPQFISEKSHPSVNIPEKLFFLSGIQEATLAKHSADTNGEAAPALIGSKRLSHLCPTEVHHGWVCGRGLPHCQGSPLSINQEACGLTSQGAGESGQW